MIKKFCDLFKPNKNILKFILLYFYKVYPITIAIILLTEYLTYYFSFKVFKSIS
jgi:hypothetical protein